MRVCVEGDGERAHKGILRAGKLQKNLRGYRSAERMDCIGVRGFFASRFRMQERKEQMGCDGGEGETSPA